MSGRDNCMPARISLRAMLLLALCACGVAVHFAGEWQLIAAGGSEPDPASRAGNGSLVEEHCEDQFIIPDTAAAPVQSIVAIQLTIQNSRAFTMSMPPLLPPPNQ